MSKLETLPSEAEWPAYQKIAFRIFFIYFFLQVIPLDWRFYQHLFSRQWWRFDLGTLFYISRYTPQFLSGSSSSVWGIGTFSDWAFIFVIAIIGGAIWSFRDRSKKEYNSLNYWIRVIVRYRLAIGIIAYGLIKFFPLQSPYPSLSNLNTPYGYFTRWKLFSMSLGIVPNYESFLGLVEIVAGSLLFYRKTATIGALVIVVFTGNVFMSNLAYEGGETVYSFYLISLALFVLSFDLIRIINLLSFGKRTEPSRFRPNLNPGQKNIGLALKALLIFVFIILYGFEASKAYHHNQNQYPKFGGLKGASGLYTVSTYKINNKILPYSDTDSTRWQDVVFEKWPTISVNSNSHVKLDSALTEEIFDQDKDKNYELAGSDGRQYYSYTVDGADSILNLKNRNSHYQNESLQLHFSRPNPSEIILSGLNSKRDSVYIVLDKVNKKYLLEEATTRTRGLKL